jgi:hypothetical protein
MLFYGGRKKKKEKEGTLDVMKNRKRIRGYYTTRDRRHHHFGIIFLLPQESLTANKGLIIFDIWHFQINHCFIIILSIR